MTFAAHEPIRECTLDGQANIQEPLPESHQIVLDLFGRHLPDWEIYVRPYLNGLRPDFVLLNPKIGIGVFEVRDWDLETIPFFVPEVKRWPPELWAGQSDGEVNMQRVNPLTKAIYCKRDIFELYCPRLDPKLGLSAITAGVILPFARGERVRNLLEAFLPPPSTKRKPDGEDGLRKQDWRNTYHPLSGAEVVAAGDIESIFPASSGVGPRLMYPGPAADLRGWLVEPEFELEQRKPLPLDKAQRALAETRTASGYRRITGPAGSGKSLVLAARAARLMNEGKSVLIATYNITLWHYLLGLVVRGVDGPGWMGRVRFTHFHYWCKTVCRDVGWGGRYDELFKSLPKFGGGRQRQERLREIFDVEMPALASDAVDQSFAQRYDAILVDEGQDYRLSWWNALRKALRPGGEMLLVADVTQDVYGTAKLWTDEAMTSAGFAGKPVRLGVSYRMPHAAEQVARTFAEHFLPDDRRDLPEPRQVEMTLEACTMRWVQCDPEAAVRLCIQEMLALSRQTGKPGLSNADITLLVDDTGPGQQVVKGLKEYQKFRNIADTFASVVDDPEIPETREGRHDSEDRRKKMGFFLSGARAKATTLHSFKGWESPMIVVHVSKAWAPDSLALIYAGLTRLKRAGEGAWLTVVCSAPELADYGRSWPEFVSETGPFPPAPEQPAAQRPY